MQVVIGVFDTQDQAEGAFVRLREAGYTDDQLALIANTPVNAPADETARVTEAGRTVAPAASVAAATSVAAVPDGTAAEAPALVGAAPVTATPGSLDREDTFRPPDDTGELRVAATSEAANNAVDNAALGTAVGMIAGGGLMGPGGVLLGGLLGALAAGGITAMWTRYRVGDAEARHYEDMLASGRYLVAVEVTEDAARARAILDEAGAARVTAEAA